MKDMIFKMRRPQMPIFLFFLIFLNSGIFAKSFDFTEKTLVLTQNFSESDVKNLKVELRSESINFHSSYVPGITVEIYANNKKLPQIFTEGETINIISASDLRKGEYCFVEVFLPNDFSLQASDISASSGAIFLENLKSDNLKIQSASGRIEAEKLESFFAEIKSVSGKIQIDSLKTEYVFAQSVSGSISIFQVQSEYFDVNSISGKLSLELKSVPQATSSASTKSGAIELFVPKEESFSLKVSTNSGMFRDNFLGTRHSPREYLEKNYNGGGTQIILTSSSGSISLSK